MSTPAIRYLKQKRIRFEVITYVHEEKGALFAAEAIGFPLERTIKTLVVDLGPQGYLLALMPGDRTLNMKHLSRHLGVKKADMADIPTAERLTGYSVGGISPFGTRKKLPAIIETALLAYDRVAINGGRRGVMLIMTPGDIVSALACDAASLA